MRQARKRLAALLRLHATKSRAQVVVLWCAADPESRLILLRCCPLYRWFAWHEYVPRCHIS